MIADDLRRKGLEALARKQRFDATLAEIDRLEGFDAKCHVDTATPVERWELSEGDDALINNARYSPTPVATIRAVLAAATVGMEQVSFVDFGAGKGRVMLVASEFPFRRIVGVEYSARLCEIARRNIERYSSTTQRCRVLEVHCIDGAEFVVPEDAGVFYFYEPFKPVVAAKVLANIESSLRAHPRRAVVCFVGGKLLCQLITERGGWFELGEIVRSPDDPYYDARLFVNRGGAADAKAPLSR